MASAKDLLALAVSQLGVKEYPAGSNCVLYNTEYYGREVYGSSYPWCCAFQWWIFKHSGASDLFFEGKKTASCSALYGYHRKQGQAIYSGYKTGDLIFFDFSGKCQKKEHIGICESFDGNYITTIDGNTGTTSEANGGAVMRRKRAVKYISGAIRPNYEVKQMTVEDAKKIVKTKVGLSDATIDFLYNYRWGDELLLKLGKAMEGENENY